MMAHITPTKNYVILLDGGKSQCPMSASITPIDDTAQAESPLESRSAKSPHTSLL